MYKVELRSLSANPCLFIPIRGERQPTEGYFPICDPPDDHLQMTIGLEEDDTGLRRDLRHLFNQNVSLRGAGRSLEGQFHTQNLLSGLYMFLTVAPGIFNVYSASHGSVFRGFGYGLIDVDSIIPILYIDSINNRWLYKLTKNRLHFLHLMLTLNWSCRHDDVLYPELV